MWEGISQRSPDARRAALERGRLAEEQVSDLLVARGWELLARNWRGGGGEIDVVVTHDGKLRFVEVKLRDAQDPLSDDAVSPHKRRRLVSAAEAWLAEHGPPAAEVCFLVAFVDAGTDPWAVRWVDDAF